MILHNLLLDFILLNVLIKFNLFHRFLINIKMYFNLILKCKHFYNKISSIW